MTIIQRGMSLGTLLLLTLFLGGQAIAREDAPTYSRDVAPLLQKACVSCHSPGGSAPFSLLTYSEVRRHAGHIVQVTQNGSMPPWQTVTIGFHNEHRLTEAQKNTLKRWVAGELLEGAKESSSPKPTPVDWPLGKPDRILTMPRTFTLPGATSETVRCFVIPSGLMEDRTLRAIVIRPSNPRIVRYATLYSDTKGEGRRQEGQSGTVGYFGFTGGLRPPPRGSLADWAPGAAILPLPAGNSLRLPKGADLILQTRFHTTGKPETEKTQIGLYFASKSDVLEPVTLRLGSAELYLPKAATAVLIDTFTLPTEARVWEIVPNAHVVGRTVTVTAQLPDKTTISLLDIRNWDTNWKQPYRYITPPKLPAGTVLTLKMEFDNTVDNPRNPWKPTHWVVPGLEAMEEMASVWVRLVFANATDQKAFTTALPPANHRPDLDIDEREPEGKPRPTIL